MTSQSGPRRPNLNEIIMRHRYDVAYRVGNLCKIGLLVIMFIGKPFNAHCSGFFKLIFRLSLCVSLLVF